MAWLDRVVPEGEPATLAAFVEAAHDPGLEVQARALSETLFAEVRGAGPREWSGGRLYAGVSRARKKGPERRSRDRAGDGPTRALNPG